MKVFKEIIVMNIPYMDGMGFIYIYIFEDLMYERLQKTSIYGIFTYIYRNLPHVYEQYMNTKLNV